MRSINVALNNVETAQWCLQLFWKTILAPSFWAVYTGVFLKKRAEIWR